MIISVFGMDHPGIVAGVSQILAEAGCSIIDINQTVVQGKFAMVIIADTSRAGESTTELKERLRGAGENLGVRIYAQREDLLDRKSTRLNSSHGYISYAVFCLKKKKKKKQKQNNTKLSHKRKNTK